MFLSVYFNLSGWLKGGHLVGVWWETLWFEWLMLKVKAFTRNWPEREPLYQKSAVCIEMWDIIRFPSLLSHVLHTCCVLSYLSLYWSTQATAVIKIRRSTHRPSFLFIFHGALVFLVASNNFSLVRFEEGSHSPLAGGFMFDRNERRKKMDLSNRKI